MMNHSKNYDTEAKRPPVDGDPGEDGKFDTEMVGLENENADSAQKKFEQIINDKEEVNGKDEKPSTEPSEEMTQDQIN